MADFIQEEISQIIREEISDPAFKEMITISRVEVSPDLKHARVYYQVHGGEEAEALVAQGFKRASSYIRRLIAKRLYTKFVPEIDFIPDKRTEEEARLEELFARIRHE